MQPGWPIGGSSRPVVEHYWGGQDQACALSQTCPSCGGCGSSGCKCQRGNGSGGGSNGGASGGAHTNVIKMGIQPNVRAFAKSGCSSGDCGGPAASSFTSAIPGAIAAGAVAAAGQIVPYLVHPNIPGLCTGTVQLNPANGNVILPIAHPGGAPFDPWPTFFYNSLNPSASAYGTGWTELYRMQAQALDDAGDQIAITDGTGAVLTGYTPNLSNYYTPTAATADAIWTPDNVSISQIQPNGMAAFYPNVIGVAGNPPALVSKFADTNGN